MTFVKGEQISRYLLIRLIGKGGFGEVWLAKDISSEQEVAVKILPIVTDDSYRAFVKEAEVAMQLKHPNILEVTNFGTEKNHPFLVMPYIKYGTLRERYPKETQLSWDTIVPYVKQLASALQHVHEKGLVHRDIKPENILMKSQYELLLSDFGITIMSYTVTPEHDQKSIGTSHYMAPEQFQQKAVRESDQYSLGIMIYELLTGHPPFEGNYDAIRYQHFKQAPVPLHKKVPSLAPEVEQIIMKMLKKDYTERFKSMSDLLAALDQIKTGSSSNEHIIFSEHTGAVHTVACSENLRYIASAGADCIVRVWEAATGKHLYSYGRHVDTIRSLAWSPDSRYIASAGADETVQVWEAMTGKPIAAQEYNGIYNEHLDAVYAVAWSPDNTLLASAGADSIVHLWEPKTGVERQKFRGHRNDINTLAWSPDGRFLASAGHDTHIYVWDSSRQILFCTLKKHTNYVTSLAWSPQGEYLASASHDKTVIIWAFFSGESIFTYKAHTKDVTGVSWSSDRIHLASSSWDGSVHVWRVGDTQPRTTIPNRDRWVNTVVWSPDGKRIAFGDIDGAVQFFSPL